MYFQGTYGLTKWGVVCTVLATLLVAYQARGEIEFGIPTPLPDPINDESANVHPWLSPDELTIYFVSTREDSQLSDLWYSTRTLKSDPWGTPQILGPQINTPVFELGPSLTEDQLELYFYRTTDPFGLGDARLWVSKRASITDPFGEPVEFDLAAGDGKPFVSNDGLRITYFSRRETSESPLPPGSSNIWVASRALRSEPFGEPELLDFGTGPGIFSPNDLMFAFYSNGGGSVADFYGVAHLGAGDVLLRTREATSELFGSVFNSSAPLNSSFLDEPWPFTLDSSTILLTSDRPGAPTGGFLGQFGIWQAPIAEAVPVDIKPDDDDDEEDANPVNLKSRGKLPVAILSTEEFDALEVDLSTLLFGDPVLIADGATPVAPRRESVEDVNDDDLDDLVLKFRMRELLENGVLGPETEQGYLTGTTYAGDVVAGRDAIRIVPARTHASIPEPSTLALAACSLLCLACWWRRAT